MLPSHKPARFIEFFMTKSSRNWGYYQTKQQKLQDHIKNVSFFKQNAKMLWVFAMGLLMFWVLAQVKRAHPKFTSLVSKRFSFSKKLIFFSKEGIK